MQLPGKVIGNMSYCQMLCMALGGEKHVLMYRERYTILLQVV